MIDSDIWRRGLAYGGAIVLSPLLMWGLSRVFPCRSPLPGEIERLRPQYSSVELWSGVIAIVAGWGAIVVMLVAKLPNSPWLLGLIFGWLVLGQQAFVALWTLSRGLHRWAEFWRYHELHYGISLRLLAPVYIICAVLGIASTFILFATRAPNQAMQRTASKPATDLLSVCHPRFGCVARCSGLAVADLVSR